MKWIFLLHLVSTFYMLGLCWFVQIVHYPLFLKIPEKQFSAYQKKNWLTGYVTGPVMILELITGLVLLYSYQDLNYLINLALIGVTGFSTLLIQIPIHIQLKRERSVLLIQKLIRTNWIRTVSWTARTALLSHIILKGLNL